MSHDAIVIGAGVAGLAAAKSLCDTGMRVAIVEARSRIGGRILTERSASGEWVELGAEFIHGRPRELLQLASQASLTPAEVSGAFWCVENNKWQQCDERWERQERFLSRMRAPVRDTSFAEYLDSESAGAPEELKPWLLSYIEGFHAADPEKISVRALVDGIRADKEVHGDHQYRLREGYGPLVQHMFASIQPHLRELFLDSPVKRIIWKKHSVKVQISGKHPQELSAPMAVITLPLGVLKAPPEAGGVRFTPEPVHKRGALRNLVMGPVVRVSLVFNERFWADEALTGIRVKQDLRDLSFVFSHEESFPTWWTKFPEESAVLSGWAAGHYGLQLSGLSAALVCEKATATLARLFGVTRKNIESRLVSYHTHDWQQDPFSRGAYSYARVGGAGAFRELAQPVMDTLFFAGEATEFHGHNGTVHGALMSGLRAAEEIRSVYKRSAA
jgi:monoamine oxidase